MVYIDWHDGVHFKRLLLWCIQVHHGRVGPKSKFGNTISKHGLFVYAKYNICKKFLLLEAPCVSAVKHQMSELQART